MEDKELVKVKTIYTKEEYIKFNKFHQRKKKLIVILNIVGILIIFLAGIGLLFAKKYVTGIIYLLLAILLLFMYLNAPKIFVNRLLKSNKKAKNLEYTYTFYNDKIEIKTETKSSTIPYAKLVKVYETGTNFYLYINKMEAFLISKKEMKSDEIYKLEKLFEKNLKKDFV